MKLELIFGSVVIIIVGFTVAGNSSGVMGQTEKGLKEYENPKIGLSFLYPSEWGNPTDYCVDTNLFCRPTFILTSNGTITPYELPTKFESARLLDLYDIEVWIDELHKPSDYGVACNCNTLKDYLVWDYSNASHEDERFINDNQTIVGKNYSAWQIEKMSGHGGSERKNILVYAINGNLGYKFFYDSPPNPFDKHLEDFKNMLKTVTFTAPMAIPEKKPSFLNSSQIP